MNYGLIIKVIVSAPYPEISWTSPWLFQAPYPSPSPCPGPCPSLYLCPFPCLGPSLCSPFLCPFHVLCLSLLPCRGLFPCLFPVLCLDHAGPYLSPCLPSLCYISPLQSHQKAGNREDKQVKD